MNVLVKIIQAGQLIGLLAGIGLELALKVKSLLELEPDVSVNIERLTGEAVEADERTMDRVNAWRAARGLPPLAKP